ncbi:hypothetical protein JCM25156A_04760 [Komagataeibacter kakiaceti JCM 25156]
MTAQLHFAEDAFTLHFFLEGLEGLINIVVTNENLHWVINSWSAIRYGRRMKLKLGEHPPEAIPFVRFPNGPQLYHTPARQHKSFPHIGQTNFMPPFAHPRQARFLPHDRTKALPA